LRSARSRCRPVFWSEFAAWEASSFIAVMRVGEKTRGASRLYALRASPHQQYYQCCTAPSLQPPRCILFWPPRGDTLTPCAAYPLQCLGTTCSRLLILIQASRAIGSGKQCGCLRMSYLAVLCSLLRLIRWRRTPCGKCVETFHFPSVQTKVVFVRCEHDATR
jgi:hypothetical protein